jgi:hypothetical protein
MRGRGARRSDEAVRRELVGTSVLVLGGPGSAVIAGGHIGFAGYSFVHGLSLPAAHASELAASGSRQL